MTEKTPENAPEDEGTASAALVPEAVDKEQKARRIGWAVWALLLMLVFVGLAATSLSRSLQIDPNISVPHSVPRDIAVKPVPPPIVKPEPPKPLPSALKEDHQPQEETPIKLEEKTGDEESDEGALNYTPIPAEKWQVALAEKKPEPKIVAQSNTPAIPIVKNDPLPAATLPHFSKPVIAIVIDDMGLDRRHSTQMVAMTAPVTLAFMPYAPQIEAQAKQAYAAGHELIVHMPMEPEDLAHNNPGPNALLLKNGTEINVQRLDKNLAAFDGYMGVNNHMGSAFTMSRAAVEPVLQDLKNRGLWFLDSKTDARSVAATVAGELGLPYASRDIFLDNVNSKQAVLNQLRQLEQVARRKGYAIAIGHPKEGTVAALAEWIPQIQQRNFTLVPLSTIIQARFPKAKLPHYARAGEFKVAKR
jgi:polysaccharide deacetylase 2 family uncharacterized protein YibQ